MIYLDLFLVSLELLPIGPCFGYDGPLSGSHVRVHAMRYSLASGRIWVPSGEAHIYFV